MTTRRALLALFTATATAGLAGISTFVQAQGGPQTLPSGPGRPGGRPPGNGGGRPPGHGGRPPGHGGRPPGHGGRPPIHGRPPPRPPFPAPPPWAHKPWRRGDRIPYDYRGRNYVIENWRPYGLPPPPYGYQWVGVGSDYLLISVRSGIIAQIVIGR
ncbi:RcnB family protein [Pandoraea terrae]|nr:RcnB family protein [Pandoraea terrae]